VIKFLNFKHSPILKVVKKGTKKVKKIVAKREAVHEQRVVNRLALDQEKARKELAQAQAELSIRQVQLQAYQAKQRAKQTRRAAGKFTVGERIHGTIGHAGTSGANFYRVFVASSAKRKK
jgi:hypothetical protein